MTDIGNDPEKVWQWMRETGRDVRDWAGDTWTLHENRAAPEDGAFLFDCRADGLEVLEAFVPYEPADGRPWYPEPMDAPEPTQGIAGDGLTCGKHGGYGRKCPHCDHDEDLEELESVRRQLSEAHRDLGELQLAHKRACADLNTVRAQRDEAWRG